MQRLPDFMIIGAMKSATTTLQEQLVQQPGIFMCEPKEPNFFSDDDQFGRGLDWYLDLFAQAPAGALLGEASTHYTKLPTHPHAVARICQHVPHARFVYVMRHPVDRLVSHYIHQWSMGIFNEPIVEAVARYPELVAYSQYAKQLQPWFDAFGRDRVLPVFFDRLIAEPQRELERVCRFIGYSGTPQWQTDLAPSNVSAQRIRRFPLYDLIVDSPLATRVRRNLVPQGVRDWVKSRLTMRQRPELNAEHRQQLEQMFDVELAELGSWLGVTLTCANFKAVTRTDTLEWARE